MTQIPSTPEQITAVWLTGVLRSTGRLKDSSVRKVDSTHIGADSGFASTVARVRLEYDPPGPDLPEPDLPTSMIVKMSATSDNAARAFRLDEKVQREVSFYTELADDIGIRIPECYYARFDRATGRGILLIQDLAPARFGDAGQGCTRNEAAAILEMLAKMHARWCDASALANFEWLPRFVATRAWFDRFLSRRRSFLERHGNELCREAAELTAAITEDCLTMFARLEGPPTTLLHVDMHLDNVAFLPDSDTPEPVLFDFQGVAQGHPAVDVAAFLSTHRAADEIRWLLDHYHACLCGEHVAGYPREKFATDFRLGCLRWWIGTVSGMGSTYAKSWTGRQAEVARQAVQRWQPVIADQNLMELIA